jgi:hypothetical protein
MRASILVRMENRQYGKCLKKMERVKGIEPSYSAWTVRRANDINLHQDKKA